MAPNTNGLSLMKCDSSAAELYSRYLISVPCAAAGSLVADHDVHLHVLGHQDAMAHKLRRNRCATV